MAQKLTPASTIRRSSRWRSTDSGVVRIPFWLVVPEAPGRRVSTVPISPVTAPAAVKIASSM